MNSSGTSCYQPALSPDSVDGAPPATVNVVAVVRRSTTSQPCMADTTSAPSNCAEETPTSLVHSTPYAPVHKIMSRQQTRPAPTSAGRKVNSPYGLPMQQPRVDPSDSSRAPMAVCEPDGAAEEHVACLDDRYHQIRQKIFDEHDDANEGQRLGVTELPPSGDDGNAAVVEEPTTTASTGTSSAAAQNGAARAPLVGGNGRRPKYALRGPSGDDEGYDIFRRNHIPFGGAPHHRGGVSRGGPGGGSYNSNAPHSHHQHQHHHQATQHHHNNHHHHHHHHHHASLAPFEPTAGAMGVNNMTGNNGWSGGPPGAHLHHHHHLHHQQHQGNYQAALGNHHHHHHHHHHYSYMSPSTQASYPFDGQSSAGPASSSDAYSDASSAEYHAFQARQSERGRHSSYPVAPPAPWMPPGSLPLTPALRGGGGGMPSVHVGMYPPPLPYSAPPPQQPGFGFQGGLDGGYAGPSYPTPFVPPQAPAPYQHAGIHHHHHSMSFPVGPHQHHSSSFTNLSYAPQHHHSHSFSHQTSANFEQQRPQPNSRRPQPSGPPRPNHNFHHHHHHHHMHQHHHHYDGEAYQHRRTSPLNDADVNVAASYREQSGALLPQHSRPPGVVDSESHEVPPRAS